MATRAADRVSGASRIPPRPLKRPTLQLAVEFNRTVREAHERFDEPDDLDRVEQALSAIGGIEEPIEAAAVLAYRISRAQGFSEGNKRTALLLARWFPVIPYDTDVAVEHAQLLAAVRRAGHPRGAHDLLIAATAQKLAHSLEKGRRGHPVDEGVIEGQRQHHT